jgi:hypothetical protein
MGAQSAGRPPGGTTCLPARRRDSWCRVDPLVVARIPECCLRAAGKPPFSGGRVATLDATVACYGMGPALRACHPGPGNILPEPVRGGLQRDLGRILVPIRHISLPESVWGPPAGAPTRASHDQQPHPQPATAPPRADSGTTPTNFRSYPLRPGPWPAGASPRDRCAHRAGVRGRRTASAVSEVHP